LTVQSHEKKAEHTWLSQSRLLCLSDKRAVLNSSKLNRETAGAPSSDVSSLASAEGARAYLSDVPLLLGGLASQHGQPNLKHFLAIDAGWMTRTMDDEEGYDELLGAAAANSQQ